VAPTWYLALQYSLGVRAQLLALVAYFRRNWLPASLGDAPNLVCQRSERSLTRVWPCSDPGLVRT